MNKTIVACVAALASLTLIACGSQTRAQVPSPTLSASLFKIPQVAKDGAQPAPVTPAEPAPSPMPIASATPPPVSGTSVTPVEAGRYLTLDELDKYGAEAGWPAAAWQSMRIIVLCEDQSLYTDLVNGSDPNGGSFGLAQLNGRFWFDRAGEDFSMRFDPVVNLRTALWVWRARGEVFGGPGGWLTCSEINGIYP